MSLINQFKELLENTSIYNVYVEFDNTPLSSRGNGFVTVGINSEECCYDIQNNSSHFTKDRISFRVRVIMPKSAKAHFIDGYFDNNILTPIMKSNTFNIVSVQKDRPVYTKYLDKMELNANIIVECISTFD